MKKIQEIIKPETDVEIAILENLDFIKGTSHGKPRPGHPEGEVIYHIEEVLRNVDKYYTTDRDKLRLIAILHDTFKFRVDNNKPKSGNNHHGMIARRFAEDFITDKAIFDILELHDEAYNAWQQGNRKNNWPEADKRAKNLIERLGSNLDLYVTFFVCDTLTGNKGTESLVWFENFVSKHKENDIY